MFAVNGFVVGTWIASIPGVQVSLAASATEIGIALLFTAAGSLVAMPITGQLLAHVPSRRLLDRHEPDPPVPGPAPGPRAERAAARGRALRVRRAERRDGCLDERARRRARAFPGRADHLVAPRRMVDRRPRRRGGGRARCRARDPPAGGGRSRPRPRSGSSRSSPVGSSERARSRRRAQAASAFRRARSCRSACWRSEPRSPKAAWPTGPASTCARASARTPPSRPSATPRSRWAWRSDAGWR